MLSNDVHKAILELCEKVEQILSKRIDQYGANRNGENTLKGSNLEKSIKVIPQEDGLALQIADYWQYVALGWRKTGRSNERGLYHALVLWALRKHIKFGDYTQNESAVIVAEKVWTAMILGKREIPARPFMVYDEDGHLDNMIPELKEYMEKWIDELFNTIIKDLDKYFNS